MKSEPSHGAAEPVDAQAIDDPRVIDMLETYLSAVATGARLDRRSVIAQYPAIATELAACFDMIDLIHRVASEMEVTRGSRS